MSNGVLALIVWRKGRRQGCGVWFVIVSYVSSSSSSSRSSSNVYRTCLSAAAAAAAAAAAMCTVHVL